MAEMKYIVIKNKNEVHIHYGAERPPEIPEKGKDAEIRAFNENWVPEGWTVVESYPDEEQAKKRRDKERETVRKSREAKKGSPKKKRGEEVKQLNKPLTQEGHK